MIEILVEPASKDKGPDPFTLLLSSLVACTLSTLRMYIIVKKCPVSKILENKISLNTTL